MSCTATLLQVSALQGNVVSEFGSTDNYMHCRVMWFVSAVAQITPQ